MAPDTYMEQAMRDAELTYADEWSAVADIIAAANTQAGTARRDIESWADTNVNGLWRDFGTEAHKLRAEATAMNMGTSGAAMAGQNELFRQKSSAASDIRREAWAKLQNINDELMGTIAEAGRTKKTILQKKSLLIGQLRDKYKAEAEALALQREQNAIARLNARANAYGAGLDENGNPLPTDNKRSWSALIEYANQAMVQGGMSAEQAVYSALTKYQVPIKVYLDEGDAGAKQFLYAIFPDKATADAFIKANSTQYPGTGSQTAKTSERFGEFNALQKFLNYPQPTNTYDSWLQRSGKSSVFGSLGAWLLGPTGLTTQDWDYPSTQK